MRIAIPKEVKNNEFRVAITPAGVQDLIAHGHQVLVETGAGLGSAITDESYRRVGATIVADAASTWAGADLVLKVKEPIASEYGFFRPDLVLFTYLHLAAEPELTKALVKAGITAIAYETVQAPSRALPLLAPMSEVAGRMAPIVGANVMLKANGGPGLLVPGVPGTHPAKVTVLGGGVAGTAAMQVSLGLGADVTVLDTNITRLRELDASHYGSIKTIASNTFEIEKAVIESDLVIGAVLTAGAKAPTLISNELVSRMKPGSVLVDIAVDQGGCFADTHATTHADPTFTVHKSLLYCVANMPGGVPITSTYALANATLPYACAIADHGWKDALREDATLALGLNTFDGDLTNAPVANAHGLEHRELAEVLA